MLLLNSTVPVCSAFLSGNFSAFMFNFDNTKVIYYMLLFFCSTSDCNSLTFTTVYFKGVSSTECPECIAFQWLFDDAERYKYTGLCLCEETLYCELTLFLRRQVPDLVAAGGPF